jgi:hypothetical protein
MEKARIILVNSCLSCPYLSLEETNNKIGYSYCWATMKVITILEVIDENCPLEEVDLELDEQKTDD